MNHVWWDRSVIGKDNSKHNEHASSRNLKIMTWDSFLLYLPTIGLEWKQRAIIMILNFILTTSKLLDPFISSKSFHFTPNLTFLLNWLNR